MSSDPSRRNQTQWQEVQLQQVSPDQQNMQNKSGSQEKRQPGAESSSEAIKRFEVNQQPDSSADVKINIKNTNFFYGSKQALFDVSLPIRERQVTALIGPSGCGKSTFLRTLNRMNDLIPNTRTQGEALFDGQNIYDKATDVVLLRQRIGMVFQKPNPFPKSIFENVAYGLRIQ